MQRTSLRVSLTEATPLQEASVKLPIPEDDDEAGGELHVPAATIELLCDLVFVVALKLCADSLEDSSSLYPGLVIFALRIFLWWNMWHMGTIIFNLSVRLDDDGILNAFDFVVLFAIMACSIFMARSLPNNDDVEFLAFYLVVRLLHSGSLGSV